MFLDELRRAIEAAPRSKLPDVAKALWGAVAAEQISETDAETLSALIDKRRTLPPLPPARKTGSRPRSPASIERRRRWAASGALPVGLAAQFTVAEQAVLAVVAEEFVKHGRCTLHIPHIAALAGVGETTVRTALREAKQIGLVAIEIRRVTAWRNDSNIVTIISAEWTTWLVRGGRGGGFRSSKGTISGFPGTGAKPEVDPANAGRGEDRRGFRGEGSGDGHRSRGYPLRSRGVASQGDRGRLRCRVPENG